MQEVNKADDILTIVSLSVIINLYFFMILINFMIFKGESIYLKMNEYFDFINLKFCSKSLILVLFINKIKILLIA